jgi:hypothetical protein
MQSMASHEKKIYDAIKETLFEIDHAARQQEFCIYKRIDLKGLQLQEYLQNIRGRGFDVKNSPDHLKNIWWIVWNNP